MPDDPRVQQLLDELCDAHATPEEVCGQYPELLPVVRERLRQIRRVEAEVDALFPRLSGARRGGPISAGDGTALPRVPGYDVEAVLGRGGMGVVYKAWHRRLNRAVALKMLLAGPYAGSGERQRFLLEAEVVAGLRHANVVQVYDVGDLDGRPYFTMEFVEGGSLAQKLAGTPQAADQAAALVATLAEAIQLAHQSGIVHRDLKPANILLTADGTPKVTDFGLARRLERGDGLTVTGVSVGTPAYMAPEQGRGNGDAIGPATDVYALGAILYELLAGRPPFRAQSAAATLQQVLADDPVPPSRLNPRVPRDLETICLKCLHKEPPRRYASAAALAEDLHRYGRGESIAARPAGCRERLARWVRRRPAAAGLLAALAVLVAGTGTGALFLYQQQLAASARQAQTDLKVRAVLERERGLLEEGWLAHDLAKLTQARAEGIRATDIARTGGASARVLQEAEASRDAAAGRLDRATKNRALLEAVLDVSALRETWTSSRDEADPRVVLAQPTADEQYADAFRRWGLDVDVTAETEVVARLGAEPAVVVQELIAALDGWMLERLRRHRPEAQWRHLFQVACRLDGSEQRRRLRAQLVGEAPPRAEIVAGLVGGGSPWPTLWELSRGSAWRQLPEVQKAIDPRTESPLTVALLAEAYAAVGDLAGAENVLRRATTARPDQVVLLNVLGKVLERQGPSRRAEAIEYYRAARGQRPQLGIALSRALLLAGRAEEAEGVLQALAPRELNKAAFHVHLGIAAYLQKKYAAAEAAWAKALDLRPECAEAYYCRGNLLTDRRQHRAAEAAHRKAIDRKPDFAEAYTNLASALFSQGKYREAEAACRKALDLKPDLVEAHVNLGNALIRRLKLSAAQTAYRKAIDLKPDLAAPYCNLALVLAALLNYREAEALCRKAIELKPDLAEAHAGLGKALVGQGKLEDAEAACRKAIALKPDLFTAYINLGHAVVRQGKYREAEDACRKALDLKPHLAVPHGSFLAALAYQVTYREAEALCRKAIDLRPDFAEAYASLGKALVLQGKYGAAEAHCRKALDLNPDLSLAHSNLGDAQMGQHKYRAAEAAYRKAIALGPSHAETHYNHGNALIGLDRFIEAEAAYRSAVTLNPDFAEAHTNLGNALFRQGRHDEAEAAYRKAIDRKPELREAYYNLGNVLMHKRQYAEAEAAYRTAIDLKPESAPAYHNLGLVLMRQSQFDNAAVALKKAGALYPARDPHRETARRLQKSCRRCANLDTRLPGILGGTDKPANAAEQLDVAQLCVFKQHYAAAARFFRDAFTAEPERANAVAEATRYDAACAAALAGCGQGKDAGTLPDKERTLWRRQALDWLAQDLAWWSKALDNGDAQTGALVRRKLRHWQADGDLAGLRAPDALAQLPEAEQRQWERLWSDVDALLRRVSQPE